MCTHEEHSDRTDFDDDLLPGNRTGLMVRWALAIIVLPLNVLVVIPGLLVWAFGNPGETFDLQRMKDASSIFALVVGTAGAGLSLSTLVLFYRHGEGTAAPWDPPQRFVVQGPYQHVRNPMITGVILMLFAESILLHSLPIACWACFFLLANTVYFPCIEEPGLRARFGDEYIRYCQHVPRWTPRWKPWRPGNQDDQAE